MVDNRFKELVKRDYEHLIDTVQLDLSDYVKELLLMQTVQGHAIQGHGFFSSKKCSSAKNYPNTTIEDVVTALNKKPIDVKVERQSLIDEVKNFLYRIIKGEKVTNYVNKNKKALFRINFLKQIKIQEPTAVLLGFYLGSRMDNYLVWRKLTEDVYGIKIGGGECVAVNKKRAKELGYSLESLAKDVHTLDETKSLIKQGVILADIASSRDIVNGYIRYATGSGTSDGLAVLFSGVNHGLDAAIGLFLADAVDTWDKYTPFIYARGQDEHFGDVIENNQDLIKQTYPEFQLPRPEDVIKFIYAIAEANYRNVISESQRYFLQYDKKARMTAIQSHLKFIKYFTEDKNEELEYITEAESIKAKYKNDKKQRKKYLKRLHKKFQSMIGAKMPPKMHIGHPNSNLTNYRLYSQFEDKFKQLY